MKRWPFLLAMVIGSASARGYTYSEVGVASNIIVIDKRVHFAQADGSLTALDLETGKVLLRKMDQRYDGVLRALDAGLLVVRYGNIFLLEKISYQKLWETSGHHHKPGVSDGILVSYDCGGTVEARRVKDGTILWRYDLGGVLHIVVHKGKVLILRCSSDMPGALALLDLKTGRQMWKKAPQQPLRYFAAYLGDESIYVACGKDGPEHLKRLDFFGNEQSNLAMPSEPQAHPYTQRSQFDLGELVFDRDRKRVYKKGREPREARSEWAIGVIEDVALPQGLDVSFPRYDLQNGVIYAVELHGDGFAWKGFLPYHRPSGRVSHWTYANGYLILGSSKGYIECVEATTGRSKWIYMFPVVNRTVSYSSPRGLPPYMEDMAKAFDRQLNRPDPAGLCLLPGGKSIEDVDFNAIASAAPAARVIRDPSPNNPFKDIRRYLLWAYAGLMGSIALFLGATVLHRVLHLGPGLAILPCLLAATVAMLTLYRYGRVSSSCTLLGKGLIIVMAALAIYHMRKAWLMRRSKLLLAASIIAVLAVVYFAWPVLLYA